jgi:hypothetical protein
MEPQAQMDSPFTALLLTLGIKHLTTTQFLTIPYENVKFILKHSTLQV